LIITIWRQYLITSKVVQVSRLLLNRDIEFLSKYNAMIKYEKTRKTIQYQVSSCPDKVLLCSRNVGTNNGSRHGDNP